MIRLRVKNFGIIEDFDWAPGEGLNVLTGETGAGKSLVVDAASALLSGKLDESDIRHGSAESRIEGVFDIAARDDLLVWLTGRGIDAEDGTLVISLDQKRGGRPVIRVNGAAVPRSLSSELGRKLIDIHGQSQHLSLLDKSSHLDFLDGYAGTLGMRKEFGRQAQELARIGREIDDISARESDAARRQDFLTFECLEIERAGLHEGEDAELENERRVLGAAEKLKALAYEAAEALDGDEGETPATSLLSQALSALSKLSVIDDSLKAQAAEVQEALYGLAETARDIRSYYARIDADPGRLEEIELRLGLIRDLKRKYGGNIPEILAFAETARRELAAIGDIDERKAELKQQFKVLRLELGGQAEELSEKRQAAASRLAQEVDRELRDLGMDRVKFRISISTVETSGGLPLPDGRTAGYDATGADRVEFLTSTNPGEPFKPLEKIASTGELSRFTLAVKTALARTDRAEVLIFDEIDIGVGGRSGDVIGRKLATLARSHQVVCVTHLPQIACYANHHFSVRKEYCDGRTVSVMTTLEGEARVSELSAMLSGKTGSRASTEGARELLVTASRFLATLKGTG